MFTTRFARGTEFTEKVYFPPGGRRRPGESTKPIGGNSLAHLSLAFAGKCLLLDICMLTARRAAGFCWIVVSRSNKKTEPLCPLSLCG